MKRSTLLLWVGMLAGSAATVVSATEEESTMRELQLARMVHPNFPGQLAILGIPTGDVTLAISRDAGGNPTDILVIESSHSLFSEAALESAWQWKFVPISESAARNAAPAVVRLSFSYQGVVFVFPTIENQMRRNVGAGIRNRAVVLPTLEMANSSPRPVNYKDPEYPATLASVGMQGEAKVTFYVDEEGKVRMPRVLSATAPEFGKAAIAAVSNWRFDPPKPRGNTMVAADSWTFKFTQKS